MYIHSFIFFRRGHVERQTAVSTHTRTHQCEKTPTGLRTQLVLRISSVLFCFPVYYTLGYRSSMHIIACILLSTLSSTGQVPTDDGWMDVPSIFTASDAQFHFFCAQKLLCEANFF